MSNVVEALEVHVVADDDPDTSYMDQEGFEKEKAQYERGQIVFVGVYAKAEVNVEGTIQEIRSPGLWSIGIFSPARKADHRYIRSVGKEEYEQIKDILKSMNVKKVPAFKNVKVSWRN